MINEFVKSSTVQQRCPTWYSTDQKNEQHRFTSL